ncbi:MAG: peptidoglycan DD-metalloendopeptidase family protein [Clostridia bacterium]|nr:peptidoglycan DD-metalloendopeptidase family protein [Clostridia bacterium]
MQQVLSMLMSLMMLMVNLLNGFINIYTQQNTTNTNTNTNTSTDTQAVASGDMTWPLKNESVILLGFQNYSDGTPHGGIDIALKSGNSKGEPFYSANAGTVTKAVSDGGYNTGYGNYCEIDHGNGIKTLYAHADDIAVSVGAAVTQGQLLGHIGQTGNATTPHLHFEVKTKAADGTETKVNPLDYVKNPYADPVPETPVISGKSGTFTFTVYGWGHGVGMSQEGCISMAKSGSTYSEILSHYYPGTSIDNDSSTPMTVSRKNTDVSLVEFLCKTVKQEIGEGAPMEALKAQAVCSYTYAKRFGFSSGQAYSSSFNYQGTNVEKAVFAVLNISNASQQPSAKYLTYNGKCAEAFYCGSVAGKTASYTAIWGGNEIAYLKGGVSSPEKVAISTKEYTYEELAALINNYATSKNKNITLGSDPSSWIKIISHDSAYSSSVGYVTQMSVGGYTMRGDTFWENVLKYGIKSPCFTVTYTP